MKKIICTLLSLTLLLALTGCKKEEKETEWENEEIPAETQQQEEIQPEATVEPAAEPTPEPTEEPEPEQTEEPVEETAGLRPEFKEAMDSYEEYYQEYCDFMNEFSKKPDDIKLLAKSVTMMAKLEEMDEKFNAWDDADLNDEELKYYLDVQTRVMKMMIDLAD